MTEPLPPTLDLRRLRGALPVNGLGGTIIYEPVIPSTNSLALALVAQDIAFGTVVLTDAQPAGRGRQGRQWVTLPGTQILLSIVLPLPFAPHWLVLATAVAATDALLAVGVPAERVGIKWPNDILIDGRKIAGILIETTQQHGQLVAVIGLGMNVNGSLVPWPDIAARATTLADALGQPYVREDIIIAVLGALGSQYAQLIADASAATTGRLWSRWRQRLTMLGHPTTVHQGAQLLTGIAEDVAPDGSLILRCDDGSHATITWGDVELTGEHQ